MRRAYLLLASLIACGSTTPASFALPAQRRSAAEAPETRPRPVAVTREALASLEAQLDRAVDRVSLPRVAGLLARDAARGYRLPGYGVVFVLTPRALPREGRDVLVHVTPRQHPTRTRRPEVKDEGGPREIETLERHVVILQNETEQARQAAEQDMERIVHELRMRLGGPAESLDLVQASGDVAAQAQPAASDTPLPPPPPWKYWFESGGTRDERTAQAMIADVRRALVDALEGHAARVDGLPPEEYVTVAVDFEVPDPFAAQVRPERTLVVRARVADIAARARAAIDLDEFRRRVEVVEY